jgi:periodic tryptophan protein 2
MALSIARDGAVFTWRLEYDETIIANSLIRKKTPSDDDEEEGYSEDSFVTQEEEEDDSYHSIDDDVDNQNNSTRYSNKSNKSIANGRGKWLLESREFLWGQKSRLSSCSFQKKNNLLLIGYENGVFGLYEMPGCISIQQLSISSSSISSASISNSGEWLVLGSAKLSQLLIWEWKSESYILKQQGHLYGIDYSSDGIMMATGGEDSKVKLWSTLSGFCTATFTIHIAPVTGVKFVGSGAGKAILSCSLDGSVRAHDLLRHKNFRTLTTATSVQFTSLASDSTGEVVCAGELFIYCIF